MGPCRSRVRPLRTGGCGVTAEIQDRVDTFLLGPRMPGHVTSAALLAPVMTGA